MTNAEMLSWRCPEGNIKRFVKEYLLRGKKSNENVAEIDYVKVQVEAYRRWMKVADRVKDTTVHNTCFHEFLLRPADIAMVLKPGDLVMHDTRYYMVKDYVVPKFVSVDRYDEDADSWESNARIPGVVEQVEVVCADGKVGKIRASDLEPASIPKEIFELACDKARNCPMANGGSNEIR